MIKLYLLILLFSLFNISKAEGNVQKLKCESGVFIDMLGVVKRWQYNETELTEIFPNGYQRVYNISSVTGDRINAFEDTELGKYLVTIFLDAKNVKVEVKTPLVDYNDINCKVVD